MNFKKFIGLFLLLTLPCFSFAAGLGEVYLSSSLNQPLAATIPIVGMGRVPLTAVTATLASEQEFTAVGLKKDNALSNLQFVVEQNKQGSFYIQASSSQPIAQPVVTFLLKLKWPNGEVLREYTLFLDPAGYKNAAPTPITASSTTSTSSPRTLTAPRSATTYGPTTTQDNLWTISQWVAADLAATIDQVMVAIAKLNPDAFVESNINGLKAGYILKLPNATQAQAIKESDAKQWIAEQNNTWQVHTQTTVLPSRPDTTISSSSQPVQPPSVSDQTEQSSAPEPRENQLQAINSPSLPAQSDSTDDFTSSPPSEVTPTQPANSDTLPALPVNALADESDASTVQSSTAETKALEQEVTISSEAIQAATNANNSLQLEINDLRAEVVALKKQVNEKNAIILSLEKVQTVNSVPSTTAESKSNTSSKMKYFILFLVILGIFSYLFLLSKKQTFTLTTLWQKGRAKFFPVKPTEKYVPPSSANMPSSIETKPTGNKTPVVNPLTSRPILSVESHATPAMLDIVDEADVYIAYGRYEKAEILLKNSLLTNPTQQELRLKLLEIYLAKKDKIAFDQALDELGGLTELSPLFQAKLSKLLEGWVNITESSQVLEGFTPLAEISTKESPIVALKPEATQPEERLMEFDGDLSHLYTQPLETAETLSEMAESTPQSATDSLSVGGEALSLEEKDEPTKEKIDTIQTQLDLANAYIDMDDLDEALSILHLVQQDGNEQQKEQAQSLIDKANQKR